VSCVSEFECTGMGCQCLRQVKRIFMFGRNLQRGEGSSDDR
jgi:hypothetical protein